MLRQVETVVSNHGLWVGPSLLRRLITSTVSKLPRKPALSGPLAPCRRGNTR